MASIWYTQKVRSRLAIPLLAALLLLPARPLAARRARRTPPAVKVERDRVDGGLHWRIALEEGVLHVWRPPGYRPQRAGVVLFVHGYHVTADRAWNRHRLVEQFKMSRQNALFVVVDGPSAPGEAVKFPSLGKVLLLVSRHARQKLPHGHIVAIGHSAGYRTVSQWLDYRYLSHVILLDALYAKEDDFHGWMTSGRHHDWHRLTLVAKDTRDHARRFMRRFQGRPVVRRDRIPESYPDLSKRERSAPFLFMDSQYGHSALVTNKKVIPVLLRRTRLRLLR